MKAALLLVVLVGAVGCSPGLTSVKAPWVYVDPAVPMTSALDGMTMWRDAVGVDWVVTTEREKAAVTIVSVVDGCIEPGHHWSGYTDDGSTQASICLGNLSMDAVPSAVAHELGHVMHLGHIAATTPAMMNASPFGAITDADKAAWHGVWGELPARPCPDSVGCY